MRRQVGKAVLELVQGDITKQEVDAIVNAANSRLAGGGGVDGAIHRAGGPAIRAEIEAKYPQGCPTGQAVITGAGNLKAKYVIHAVGPIYRGGSEGEAAKLASAYRKSLELARQHGCKTVAFPSISTGAYGYPVREAAHVALRTVLEFLRAYPEDFQTIRFVLFDKSTYDAYAEALRQLAPEQP
jgi:O-acetyl-ADP-ribose deacetylase (regulator of RNase III)